VPCRAAKAPRGGNSELHIPPPRNTKAGRYVLGASFWQGPETGHADGASVGLPHPSDAQPSVTRQAAINFRRLGFDSRPMRLDLDGAERR